MEFKATDSKHWVKPAMVRIGTIGDVAANLGAGNAQRADNTTNGCPGATPCIRS